MRLGWLKSVMLLSSPTIFRKLDVEKDIWQVVAADMDLEDSLIRITDAFHRHEPKVRILILLANKSNNPFAFAQSARLNDTLNEVFTGAGHGVHNRVAH